MTLSPFDDRERARRLSACYRLIRLAAARRRSRLERESASGLVSQAPPDAPHIDVDRETERLVHDIPVPELVQGDPAC